MSRKKKKTKLYAGNRRSKKRNIPFNKSPIDVAGVFTKALRYHQSGQLQKAGEIYRRILDTHPNHSDSLHLLGLIAHESGKGDIAVDLINKAIKNNPECPVYYNNLGRVFNEQGRLKEAISCYQNALESKPDYPEAYNNMGAVFKNQGRLKDAVSCYQKALNLSPDFVEAYNNMGNAFQAQGNSEEAISCYQNALKLKPDYPEAYNNLGTVFKNQGRLKEAISCYQKALESKPDYPEAYNNMGNVLRNQRKLKDAISCYQKALNLSPNFVEAHNNLGTAFQNKGKPEEAISCYRRALEIKPAYAEAYNNLGNVFVEEDRLNDAISCYQKALEIKPEFTAAYCELFHQLQRTCEWQGLEGMEARLNELTREALDKGTKTAETPFFNLSRETDLSRNFAIAKSRSRDITRAMSNLDIHFSFNERRRPSQGEGRWPSRTKITVGYLSNDFRDHPMAHLMLGLFGLHNRDQFEILCYSYGEDDGSYYRKRIEQDCDRFVDLQNLDHAEAAKCIYQDQVDILVDLKGYMRGGRLEICALRPAPVQVRYLGLAGTTGADFFDYLITDRIVTPRDHAHYYSENFLYLPHCYQINDNTRAISDKDWKRADFGLSEGSFVFCSFNQGYKIEPVMFDRWMKILRQVPGSVLWLQGGNETTEMNLKGEAEKRGMSSSRLIFAERLSKEEHLGRLRLADLALDTRIVSGAATTSDALWAGVPVITLEGCNFASRMSSSILSAIGLSDLITHSLEAYEALAVRLARDPGELQAIGQRLAKNQEPLFDTPRFTRNLEKAYKEMWKLFVNGERPRQIEVVES